MRKGSGQGCGGFSLRGARSKDDNPRIPDELTPPTAEKGDLGLRWRSISLSQRRCFFRPCIISGGLFWRGL